jgi:dihydrodipicolinate synthase/N-acetylneuraminate lyase
MDATRAELRRFGLTVGLALVALAAVATWRGHRASAVALGGAGAVLAAFGVVAPARLRAVHRAWMAAAHAMSRVTTPVLMAVVYFGVLTPLGVAMRVGRRGRRRPTETYLVRRPAGARRSDLRRQF